MWIFNAENIQNEAAYIDSIEKGINAQLTNHFKNPELFVLVKTYQVILTLELAQNTTRMNVTSRMVDILLRRQLLQNHFILNLTMMKSKRF